MINPYKIQIKKQVEANILSLLIWSPLLLFFIVSLFLIFFISSGILKIIFGVFFLFIIGSCIWVFIFQYLYLKSLSYDLTENNFIVRGGVIGKFERIVPYSRIQHITILEPFSSKVLSLALISIEDARQIDGSTKSGRAVVPIKGKIIPGLLKEDAEKLRDEIFKRVMKTNSGQGI